MFRKEPEPGSEKLCEGEAPERDNRSANDLEGREDRTKQKSL